VPDGAAGREARHFECILPDVACNRAMRLLREPADQAHVEVIDARLAGTVRMMLRHTRAANSKIKACRRKGGHRLKFLGAADRRLSCFDRFL